MSDLKRMLGSLGGYSSFACAAFVAGLLIISSTHDVDAARPSHDSAHVGQAKEALKEELNLRPIIGILSQPGYDAGAGTSWMAASYVKWIEAAGARVIPILYDMSTEELGKIFNIINGLLIPGGGARLAPFNLFYDTAATLLDMAVAANDKGDYFPVHGTCLGIELLAVAAARNYTLLEDFEAEDNPTPLIYTPEAQDSRLFQALPPYVVADLQDEPIAMENHGRGLSMKAYEENPALMEFFKVLSLSIDKAGKAYVSTIEGRKYPVTATQWHPEKNLFEWTPHLHIPHTPHAVELGQEMANFFVSEARHNFHHANGTVEEDELLIYNWVPEFSGKHKSLEEHHDFEQIYTFDSSQHPLRRQRQLNN